MEEAPSWLSLVLDAPRGNGQRSKGAGTKESCCYPATLASGGWTVPRGTRSHAPAPRRLWVWVNTAGGGCRPPVVPTALEEEKLLEKTRPAGRCPGRGGGVLLTFLLSGMPDPAAGAGRRWQWAGQDGSVLHSVRLLQEDPSPSPCPSWSLAGAAEWCLGMEGLTPRTYKLGPGVKAAEGQESGAGFASGCVAMLSLQEEREALTRLRTAFPSLAVSGVRHTFQSLPWQVGAP